LELVERNALNFRPPVHAAGVLRTNEDSNVICEFVNEQLEKLGVIS